MGWLIGTTVKGATMSQGYHCARHLSKYFDEETLGGAGPYSALWGLYSFTGYYLATIREHLWINKS